MNEHAVNLQPRVVYLANGRKSAVAKVICVKVNAVESVSLREYILYRGSDGHSKPFCTKAITTIDNFKNALGDIDKSQFLKAISVIDKL